MNHLIETIFDFETEEFAPGYQAPMPVAYGVESSPGVATLGNEAQAKAWFVEAIKDPNRLWIAHNAAFDMCCAMYTWPETTKYIYKAYWEDRVICTVIMARLIDIMTNCDWDPRGHSLGAMTQRLGYPVELDKDTFRTRYHEFRAMPVERWPSGARDYLTHDVLGLRHVWGTLKVHMPNLPTLFETVRTAFIVQKYKVRGIFADAERVDALEQRFIGDYETAKERLMKVDIVVEKTQGRGKAKRGIGEFAGKKKIVLERAGELFDKNPDLPRPELTPTGQIKINQATADILQDEIVQDYVTYSNMSGRLKFIEKLRAGIHTPLHPEFNMPKTTGRLASGEDDK